MVVLGYDNDRWRTWPFRSLSFQTHTFRRTLDTPHRVHKKKSVLILNTENETEKKRTRKLTHVMITTIQNRLITPTPFTNTRQRINNSQTNLLPLLRLIDSDIFDVSDESQVA